jgi:putative PIN family toxin of toxin-antitoxin system
MKIFFDTNVYVAEALLGEAAVAMISATEGAGWRIFCSDYVLDELVRVLAEYRHFSPRFSARTRRHVLRRCQLVDASPSRHRVPNDPKDSPILVAALAAGADYLVTNDSHLLTLNPYEGVRIVSMGAYYQFLEGEGLLK